MSVRSQNCRNIWQIISGLKLWPKSFECFHSKKEETVQSGSPIGPCSLFFCSQIYQCSDLKGTTKKIIFNSVEKNLLQAILCKNFTRLAEICLIMILQKKMITLETVQEKTDGPYRDKTVCIFANSVCIKYQKPITNQQIDLDMRRQCSISSVCSLKQQSITLCTRNFVTFQLWTINLLHTGNFLKN